MFEKLQELDDKTEVYNAGYVSGLQAACACLRTAYMTGLAEVVKAQRVGAIGGAEAHAWTECMKLIRQLEKKVERLGRKIDNI